MSELIYRNLFGWKYELKKDCVEAVDMPGIEVDTEFIRIHGGFMVIEAYYAWNGANVVPDSPDIMRASLFHDALYQLIKEKHLEKKWRKYADQLLRDIYLREAYRLKREEKAKRELKRAHAKNRTPSGKKSRLNWFEKASIKAYAAVIYRAVRVGGGITINKSEYPDENIVRL